MKKGTPKKILIPCSMEINNEGCNKFADLAIAANADYLVTNDKDFNSLKTLEFPKLSIVNIEEFRKIVLP